MLTKLRLLALTVALGSLAAGLAGCLFVAGGAAGAAGWAYVEGAMEGAAKAGPEKVAAATEKAFDSLKITLVSTQASGTEGKVTGRTGDDTAVVVSITAQGDGISKVSIRFGTFGDKDRSRALMDEIQKRL